MELDQVDSIDTSPSLTATSLEKRIADNIERQRIDFQRQARLLEEVQRDVSRLQQPVYIATNGFSNSHPNTTYHSDDDDHSNHSDDDFDPIHINLSSDLTGTASTLSPIRTASIDRDSVSAVLHRSSSQAAPKRVTATPKATPRKHHTTPVRAQFRQVQQLQTRLHQADQQSIELVDAENIIKQTQVQLHQVQHTFEQERHTFQMQKEEWLAQQTTASQTQERERQVVATLRGRVSTLELKLEKEHSQLKAAVQLHKQKETVHSQQTHRLENRVKHTEEERTRLAEECLRFRAETSKLLSSTSHLQTQQEQQTREMSAMQEELLLFRTNRNPEMIELRQKIQSLQTSKLDLVCVSLLLFQSNLLTTACGVHY